MAHYDVDEECRLVHFHVDRIGKEKGTPGNCTFGQLFVETEQVFESLVGSLKAARKRKVIDFVGQLLLMPVNKDVVITLAKPYDPADYGGKQ